MQKFHVFYSDFLEGEMCICYAEIFADDIEDAVRKFHVKYRNSEITAIMDDEKYERMKESMNKEVNPDYYSTININTIKK